MTRRIDDDAVKRRIWNIVEKWKYQGRKYDVLLLESVIAQIVDTQPTLTPPNEWVSVEDALPPEHESVLCIVSGKPKSNITLEDAYQLGSWNKADGWIIDEWLDWEGANVTWWMKLPEPPDRRPPEGEV